MHTWKTLLLLVCLVAVPALGEPGPEQPSGDREKAPHAEGERPEGVRHRGGPPDAKTRELLEQVMMARLSKELELSEEQTVILVRKFTEYREQARELRKKRYELLRQLQTQLKENKEDAGIAAKLEEIKQQDDSITQARRDLFTRASEGLAIWQQARLYVFMDEFESELRRVVQRAKEKELQRKEREEKQQDEKQEEKKDGDKP